MHGNTKIKKKKTYTTLVLIQIYHTAQHKYAVTRFIFDNSIFLGFDTAD